MDESMFKDPDEVEEFVIERRLDGEEPTVIRMKSRRRTPEEEAQSKKHGEEFDRKHTHRCSAMTAAEAQAQIRITADKIHMVDFSGHIHLLGEDLMITGAPYKKQPDLNAVYGHIMGVKFCPFCGEAIKAIEYTGTVDSPDSPETV